MEPLNGLSSLKIALLIDFDNVLLGIDDPGFDVELVVNALRERGSIVMGRCYGDWYRHNRHRRKLMEQGLELVETPAFGPVIKNSADIRIALDGLEIGMTQHHIDTFCLVSGDSDFLPLIKKLQYLGKKVLVICGTRFTSDMLRRNCNEFISYENLLAQSVGATEDATTLDGAFALLHRAIAALRERGSEIRSSTVKQMMLQLNPVFSERNFGCPQFRGFLDKAVAQNLIKLGSRDKTSGEFFVLLPEEEEIFAPAATPTPTPIAVEAKVAIETPRGRAPRTPRSPREPRNDLKTLEIPAAPMENVPVERPITTPEVPTFSEAQLAVADPFAPAEGDDTEDHSTTAASLMSRGLRRGRLRFSGKTGRPERLETTPLEAPTTNAQDVDAPVLEPLADIETLPAAAVLAPESAPDAATTADLQAVAQQVEETIAQITQTVAEPVEMGTAPELEAVLEAQTAAASDVEAPKKTARRRRRKSANAEKEVAETNPADEAVAAQNEADNDAMGLTFPGQAFEIAPAEAETVMEPEAEPVAEVAVVPDAAPDAVEEMVAAVEAAPEVEAAKKPVRRRRSPRKKAEETPES